MELNGRNRTHKRGKCLQQIPSLFYPYNAKITLSTTVNAEWTVRKVICVQKKYYFIFLNDIHTRSLKIWLGQMLIRLLE